MHLYKTSSASFFYIFYKSEAYHQSVTATEQNLPEDQLLKIMFSKITNALVFLSVITVQCFIRVRLRFSKVKVEISIRVWVGLGLRFRVRAGYCCD